MPDVDVGALLATPPDRAAIETLRDVAADFSAYPTTLSRLLGDPTPARRALGVIRFANDLCAGAHTALGCAIAENALACLLERGATLGLEPEMLLRVEGALLSGLANALYLEGRFEEVEALVDTLSNTALVEDDGYWNAAAIAVRARVRRFDLETAVARLAAIPERFRHVVHYALAEGNVETARQARFTIPRPRTLREKHADVWLSNVAEQRTALLAIRADLARSPPEAAHLADVDADLEQAIEELDRFSARLAALEETRALRDEMLATLQRFSTLMLRVQNVRFERVETAPLLAIDRVLERVQQHLALELATARELDDIDRARHWCEARGDTHGRLMLLWIGALIATETDRADEARRRLRALLDALEEEIARRTGEDDRGRLANYFYDLPAKVFDRFAGRDPREVFRAAELRKSRTLLSMRAGLASTNDIGGEERLGARTHYLGVTVLEDTSRVLLTYHGASGRVTCTEVALEPAAIRRAAARLAPDRWRERELFGPPSAALPETLRPLLKPLERALARGEVQDGDHVCVAADDPVSLMPLQIALLGDRFCVERVSLSRVTSFADACAIAERPVIRPERALLVSIPVDERQAAAKAAAVERTAGSLGHVGLTLERLDGPIAHERLLGALAGHRLVHIDAHGFFPAERDGAFERAGLLVPQTIEAQQRVGRPDRILSSADIHRAAPLLSNAHITLNACVSGVARPGEGGDMLGLELALRLKGAASVLATHWDVRWPLSAEFLGRFYRLWLGEERPRGAAWRRAMLGAMTEAPVPVTRAEEWGAFGLYGDWR